MGFFHIHGGDFVVHFPVTKVYCLNVFEGILDLEWS